MAQRHCVATVLSIFGGFIEIFHCVNFLFGCAIGLNRNLRLFFYLAQTIDIVVAVLDLYSDLFLSALLLMHF